MKSIVGGQAVAGKPVRVKAVSPFSVSNTGPHLITVRFFAENGRASTLTLHTASGKLAGVLYSNASAPQGIIIKTFDTRALSPGMYLVKLDSGVTKTVRRVIVVE
jgi:hypothetical protein